MADGLHPIGGSVLAGFGESVAGPEVAWSLLGAGFGVTVFSRKRRPLPIGLDRRVRVARITAPEDDALQSAADLAALVRQSGWAAVLPIDDASLWLLGRNELPPHVRCAGPWGAALELALDKRLQLDAARRCGLHVPSTETMHQPGECVSIAFPLIVKPALAAMVENARLHRGRSWRCANAEEFRRTIGEWGGRWPALVQPLLAGEGRGIFAIGDGSAALHPSGHIRVRMMNPAGSGASACRSSAPSSVEQASLDSFVRLVGWSGMFMIELLRDHHGQAWFMEVNGRAWGSMALARRCGLEYPAWTVRQALGERIDGITVPPASSRILCRHLGRELVHLLHVLKGPRSAAGAWPERMKRVAGVMSLASSDRWYNSEKKMVLLSDAFETVRTKLF